MTTVSAVATKVRIATAASAIVAAATLVPAAVAYASPAAPLPQATGSTLAGGTVEPCDPAAPLSCLLPQIPQAASIFGDSNGTPILQNSFVWLGAANPNFKPLIGIVLPNLFGLDFEACFLGAAVHMTPYTGHFVGLGLGC